MKNYSLLFCLGLIIFLFSNCEKDQKEYYYSLGTLSKTDDSTLILTDDYKRFLVNNPSSVSELDSNDRAIFYYTFSDVDLPTGIDDVVSVNYYDQVLFKPIINLRPSNADSIGDDPVLIREMWIAKDYLNINFIFYGTGNINHLINLTKTTVPTDTVELEFRHNANNDSPTNQYNGFISFDLSSVKNNITNGVILEITAKDMFDEEVTEYVNYIFD